MRDISQLPTPALLLDLDVLEKNLQWMQDRANKFRVSLRPHIKTHKCADIAQMQKKLGAKGITVSTFYEAQEFVRLGFTDITWAFPMPIIYADAVAALARKATIRIVVDSFEALKAIDAVATDTDVRIHVWLKVDCGYHRAGVNPHSPVAEELVKALVSSRTLNFDGILTHAGHSYSARSVQEITTIAEQERTSMVDFAAAMKSKGYAIPAISIGSTPTASLAASMEGITEIRPGNYCFHDYTQAQLGVCTVGDCALTVLASVISHQPGASHFITDAGALALSKDAGATHLRNDMGMGILFEDYPRKRLVAHVDMQIQSLSQEHGTVRIDKNGDVNRFGVGERIRILEHHSCLTAAMFDKYHVVRGEHVMDEWTILRGRM